MSDAKPTDSAPAAESEKAVVASANNNDASSDSDTEAVDINEASLLRKLDARLLPAVGILYLLSFLDRSNVGNARIEGLATDLHMSEWKLARLERGVSEE